jgi:hypothetical protein
MPQVLDLHGRGGVVPEGAVYIGRACNRKPWRLRQSKWHNRFRIGRDGTLEEVLAKYERWLGGSTTFMSCAAAISRVGAHRRGVMAMC